MDPAVLIPIVIAIITPIGAYVLAARRMSGKIGTSDAEQLWEESRSIREDYRTRLLQANERALSLEVRMAKAEATNNELMQENYECKRKVAELESLVDQLRAQLEKA